ncbi:rCG27836, partial [Rattus norvegicus]
MISRNLTSAMLCGTGTETCP